MRYSPNDEERKKWQNPETILDAVGLKRGDTFVDVGCGEGFFALPAARRVGPEGAVYGIDINGSAIDQLRKAAEEEGHAHLHAVQGRGENTLVCQHCAHFVFYGICLHDFEDPVQVLNRARTMIRDDGLLIDLDWKAEPTPIGPPVRIRFSVEKACKLIEEAGFDIRSVKDAGPCHYCIQASPK